MVPYFLHFLFMLIKTVKLRHVSSATKTEELIRFLSHKS